MSEATISKPCNDNRCIYATSQDGCNCDCGGTYHGSGINNPKDPIWVAKEQRLATTRKAYRKEMGISKRAWKKSKEYYEEQYKQWKEDHNNG